jgi:uncharacterized membrane protein (DUF4010 family)
VELELALAQRLAVALAIGLVIGAERGFEQREAPPGSRTAGVRTFALTSLLGGVAALLGARLGPAVPAVGFVAVAALALAGYAAIVRRQGDVGLTTEVALLLAFSLGALAGAGVELEAVAAAVVVAALLGWKRELHRGLAWLERRELSATLQLLLIAAVVLPLLPDRGLGPWQALNPRRIGLLVLLLAAVSYVGWFAVRLLGPRVGLSFTALLGGLTSSTAVTLAYARLARRGGPPAGLLGAGVQLACGVMALRLFAVVALVAPALAARLAPPLAALALVPFAAAVVALRRDPAHAPTAHAELPLGNPLELESALVWAAALSALVLLVNAAESAFGTAGVYAVAALSGVADVDAVALSLAQATGGRLDPDVAVRAITLAASVNTGVKVALCGLVGGRALARAVAPGLLGGLAAALAIAALR